MPFPADELKQYLLQLHRFASQTNSEEFSVLWDKLAENQLAKKLKDDDFRKYFELFSRKPFLSKIKSIVEQLIKDADETAGLFFLSGLIDRYHLLADLYSEKGLLKDSLFFKCISYDSQRKQKLFLDLLFDQTPSEQKIFVELFKNDYIDLLHSIDSTVTVETLVYLANKNYLNLEAEIEIGLSGNLLIPFQEARLLQILYLLMQNKELSEAQHTFLAAYKNETIIKRLKFIMEAGNIAIHEARNLANDQILQDVLGSQCEEISLCYTAYLKKQIDNCYKEKLTDAIASGDLIKFRDSWEILVEIYTQDTAKVMDSITPYFNLILTGAVKGGSESVVKLILQSNCIMLDSYYKNNGRDGGVPLDRYNVLGLAAFCNNPAIVKLLLEHGANVNSVPLSERDYCSPLAIAITKGNRDCVTLLLETEITVWNKEQEFRLSPIEAAIVSDFKDAKESAYTLRKLFNKLTESSKSELITAFKEKYLDWLARYRKPEAQWTLRFLLKEHYLEVDELLKISYFFNSTEFRNTLLKKIIDDAATESTGPTESRVKFLKTYSENLRKLISNRLYEGLFTFAELTRLKQQPTIISLLTKPINEEIDKACSILQYQDKLLTLALFKEIIDPLEHGNKREKNLEYSYFYQSIKKFTLKIQERFAEKKPISNEELDEDEIQTLLVILEDFEKQSDKEVRDQTPLFQLIVKKLAITSSLNLLTKKAIHDVKQMSVPDILPEQFQEKIDHIKQVVSQLGRVDSDGRAVLDFMEHLLKNRTEIEAFFRQQYTVYFRTYGSIQIALHTENVPRGNIKNPSSCYFIRLRSPKE